MWKSADADDRLRLQLPFRWEGDVLVPNDVTPLITPRQTGTLAQPDQMGAATADAAAAALPFLEEPPLPPDHVRLPTPFMLFQRQRTA